MLASLSLFGLLLGASHAIPVDPHCRVNPPGSDNVQCHWPQSHTLGQIDENSKKFMILEKPGSPLAQYLMLGLKVGANGIKSGYNYWFAATVVDGSNNPTLNCFVEFPKGCVQDDVYYCYNSSASQTWQASGSVVVTNLNLIIPGTNLPGSWAEVEQVKSVTYSTSDGSKTTLWSTSSWSLFNGQNFCGASGTGSYCSTARTNDTIAIQIGDGHCESAGMSVPAQGGCSSGYNCLKPNC